jgi:hypothetical protein
MSGQLLQKAPKRVERAIEAGVESGRSFPFSDASRLLEEGGDGAGDTVVRQPDGTLFVACSTEIPGVTPDMWDWWQRLAIAFQPPPSFGLDQGAVDAVGTAICARTALRRVHLYGGYLIHLVRTTPTGSEMLSRFWLGHIEAPIPGIRRPLDAILNSGFVRSRLLPDDDGLNLLRHCSDEMSHLARILPELHQRFGAASP